MEVLTEESLVLFTNNPFLIAEGDAGKIIPKTVTWPVGRWIESEHKVVPTYSYITLLLWPFESHSAASWPLTPEGLSEPRFLGNECYRQQKAKLPPFHRRNERK